VNEESEAMKMEERDMKTIEVKKEVKDGAGAGKV
jgi:hypothetical protein